MAYCPECGKKVAEHATFCPSCGKKIKAEETKPEIKEEPKKEAPKESPKEERPVTSTTPKSGGSGAAMGCGIAAIIVALLIVGLCVFGFFALTFVGAQGQPNTIAKSTATKGEEIKVPMDLKASAGDKDISLSWKKSSSNNVSEYAIYKSTKNGSDFAKISTVKAENLSYNDTSVKKGVTYYYYVTAQTSSSTESGNSNQVNASLTPNPIIPNGVTSWQNVLDKYNADSKYSALVGQVTGLTKADIEVNVAAEAKGKKLKTTLKKGTLITNTTEDYKIIPQYYLPVDKEFLTDTKGVPHIMMWCGNPIKLIKKPSPVAETIQKISVNIVNIMPVYVTNIIVNASTTLNTFVVNIFPNSFGTTVMNPEATDTDDEWPEDQILIDTIDDIGPGATTDPNLEAGQQWASHGKILLEASPPDPAPSESVIMIIHIFPAEAGVSVTYSVSGTDGYTASGTLTTDADGKTEFNIPGGGESVVDTITVTVPSRGDEGSTSYTF